MAFVEHLRANSAGLWTDVFVSQASMSGGMQEVTFELRLSSADIATINAAYDRFREEFFSREHNQFPPYPWCSVMMWSEKKVLDIVLYQDLADDTWKGQHNQVPYSLQRRIRSIFRREASIADDRVTFSVANKFLLIEAVSGNSSQLSGSQMKELAALIQSEVLVFFSSAWIGSGLSPIESWIVSVSGTGTETQTFGYGF